MNTHKVALLCASLLYGCAHSSATAGTEAGTNGVSSTVQSITPQVADASRLQPGTGHLTVTGSESLSQDFKVSECRNEGRGAFAALGGYTMSGAGKNGSFGAGVTVVDYDKDGTYHPLTPSEAAASTTFDQATKSMNAGGILKGLAQSANPSLNVALQSRPLYAGKASTLVVTINERGLSGSASFTNWLPLAKSGEARMYGDPVSGSMTWACIGVKEPG